MDPERTAQTIRETRGPTFAVLVMMMALGRPTGLKELVGCTGYGEHAVHDALEQLARLGWAVRRRRYQGWELTAAGLGALSLGAERARDGELHQAPLEAPGRESEDQGEGWREAQLVPVEALEGSPIPEDRPARELRGAPLEADELRGPQVEWRSAQLRTVERGVEEGGRGEVVQNHRRKAIKPSRSQTASPHPPCPPPPESPRQQAEAGAVDADAEAAVAALRALGCPRHTAGGKGAQDAVEAALAGGWSGAEVLEAVEGWRAYAQGERGRGLVHPGFFVAARVRALERAPEAASWRGGDGMAARDAMARAYIAAAYERIVVR